MKKIVLTLIAGSVCLNLILGIFLYRNPPARSNEYEPSNAAFAFLSPRIFVNNPNDIILNFVPLRESLRDYTKTLSGFGVYFEYLPSGVSIGINEKQSYVLASLLKTPMVMAAYEEIEKGNWKKDDVFTVEQANLDPFFGDLYKKGAGTKLTVEDAIRLTLVDSDNTAKNVIFTHLPDKAVDDVFDFLDIPKETDGLLPIVTPKNYSSIIRSLYLSSFLEKANSNEILDLLTQSSFNDKLTAKLPKELKVAHKIGVYEKDNPDKSIFTDCGIVYVPKRPYILCLMERDTEKNAQEHMSTVSKIVYDYVSDYKK